MKKETKNISIDTSGDQELIESLVDACNFEKIEKYKILSDTCLGIGWLIFAFCVLNVIKRWISFKD